MIIEICSGSIEDIQSIKDLNIDRIELNHAIELGGLTPSIATLKKAKSLTNLPIMCMVRCRSGNFIYTDLEKEVMFNEAKELIDEGADGLVFGSLNDDLSIDIESVKKMREIALNKTLVFHKAFDELTNKEEGIECLIKLGVDRILLMGKQDYDQNINYISYLNQKYGDKIELLPGGGVTKDNILDIIDRTKVSCIHGTFKKISNDHIVNDKKLIKEIISVVKGES